MEIGHLTDSQEKTADMIQDMMDKVVARKGFDEIQANLEGYDTPSKIRDRNNPDKFFIPDITGTVNGRKSYFELGLKTEGDQTRELVTKWRLLADLAGFKNGKLYIAVPRGNMAFINRIMTDYTIQAEVVKI